MVLLIYESVGTRKNRDVDLTEGRNTSNKIYSPWTLFNARARDGEMTEAHDRVK